MGKVVDFKKKIKENNERVLFKMKTSQSLSTGTVEDSFFPSKGVFDRKKGRMVPARKK